MNKLVVADNLAEAAADIAIVAGVLDEVDPTWFSRIDVDDLCMASCERCVLGQAFGAYGDTLNTHPRLDALDNEIGEKWLNLYPFSSVAAHDFWAAEIEKRQAA